MKKKKYFKRTTLFIISAIFAFLFLMPTVLTITNSFMTQSELNANYGMIFSNIISDAKTYISDSVTLKFIPDKVTVSQTGCIGICQYEPVVEIFEAGKDKVTYVKMDREKAKDVVEKHLKGGQIVTEYTIGAYEK